MLDLEPIERLDPIFAVATLVKQVILAKVVRLHQLLSFFEEEAVPLERLQEVKLVKFHLVLHCYSKLHSAQEVPSSAEKNLLLQQLEEVVVPSVAVKH